MKRSILMRFLLWVTVFFALSGITGVATGEETGLSIIVQVKGGAPQQYNVANGESFFIPTSQAANQPPVPKQPDALDQKTGQLSKAIAAKVIEIQNKQKDIDGEVYITTKPTLIIEKQNLEQQLSDLQVELDRLNSEKTIRELKEKKQEADQAAQKPNVVSGIQVTPTLQEGKVQFAIKSQNIQSTVSVPMGTWVPIAGIQPEIWIKVEAK